MPNHPASREEERKGQIMTPFDYDLNDASQFRTYPPPSMPYFPTMPPGPQPMPNGYPNSQYYSSAPPFPIQGSTSYPTGWSAPAQNRTYDSGFDFDPSAYMCDYPDSGGDPSLQWANSQHFDPMTTVAVSPSPALPPSVSPDPYPGFSPYGAPRGSGSTTHSSTPVPPAPLVQTVANSSRRKAPLRNDGTTIVDDASAPGRRSSGGSTASRTPPSGARPPNPVYWCTFCRKPLTEKSWKRHEESQHQPLDLWMCMAHGPRFIRPQPGEQQHTSQCAFCDVFNPSQSHFERHHRISDCLANSFKHRLFARKDHLAQHVKLVHGARLREEVASQWKSSMVSAETGYWGCGFCGTLLESWDDRASHIAAHFREGLDMTSWDPSRVFPRPNDAS